MSRFKRCWSLLIVVALCLPPAGLAQGESRVVRPPETPAGDEDALRKLVNDYFAAWAKKDLEAFASLWSDKSPDLAAGKKTMQEAFAASEQIELKSLAVRKLVVDGRKASARVAIEMSGVEAKTGKPAAGLGKMNRALSFVKEDGVWKIWREAAAEEDLAMALIAAKEGERAALLAEDKELMTAELWKALVRQATRQYSQGNYPQALAVSQLAQHVAEQIGDREGVAQALNDMGAVRYALGDNGLALDYLRKSLTLREASGDRARAAVTLTNIATVHSSQGNYSQAAVYYQKALTEFESVGHKLGAGAALIGLGNIYRFQGDYGLAAEKYEKALRYFEAVGNQAGVAISLNNIGGIQQNQGRYGLALDYFHRSLRLKEASGNKAGVAATLINIGDTYKLQGDYGNRPRPHLSNSTGARRVVERAVVGSLPKAQRFPVGREVQLKA